MAFRLKSSNSQRPKGVSGITKAIAITPQSNNEYVAKSGEDNLDLNKIRLSLLQLKNVANEKIRSLNDNDRHAFHYIVQQVQKNYDISDSYEKLYQAFTEIFGDIKDIKPGTVAAYIIGCAEKNGAKGCSAICVGSAPAPHTDMNQCDYRVIWAYYDGGYTLISLAPSLSKDALIYVDSREPFRGLSALEKKKLEEWHIETVAVASYDSTTKSYRELVPRTTIARIPDRVVVEPSNFATGGNPNAVFFVLLLVLLLIVIYVGWRLYNNR